MNPLGVKGVGECATIPVAVAVVGAVEHAVAHCGVRVTEFPLTPVRLLELLTQAEARAAAPTDSGSLSMEFTNTFHVSLPLDEAWQLMLDVPRIMPCLPGARLTEVLGPDKYQGSVTVRLGPIKLGFEGQAELVRKDEATHTAWLQGSGMDPKGAARPSPSSASR